jgi:hypothetical protein
VSDLAGGSGPGAPASPVASVPSGDAKRPLRFSPPAEAVSPTRARQGGKCRGSPFGGARSMSQRLARATADAGREPTPRQGWLRGRFVSHRSGVPGLKRKHPSNPDFARWSRPKRGWQSGPGRAAEALPWVARTAVPRMPRSARRIRGRLGSAPSLF